MPAAGMASKALLRPYGAKPLPSTVLRLKFEAWKALTSTATMTSTIMPSFHQTSTLLIRANQRTPK